MLRRLFCYGTLEVPAIMAALIGRVPRGRAATLTAHRCRRLRNRPWLGIAPAPGELTSGTLYERLTPAELRRLDGYEGADYRRGTVRVDTREGRRRSWAYLPRRPLVTDDERLQGSAVDTTGWRALRFLALPHPRPASKTRPR